MFLSFRIYLDGTWHGEVKANSAGNRNGYQYILTDLNCGQSYDVNVKVGVNTDVQRNGTHSFIPCGSCPQVPNSGKYERNEWGKCRVNVKPGKIHPDLRQTEFASSDHHLDLKTLILN